MHLLIKTKKTMYTVNLSKLVNSEHFFEMLWEEGITFENIYTDNPSLDLKGVKKIDCELWEFFKNNPTNWRTLIILSQLGIHDIIPHITNPQGIKIISSWSLISSLAEKIEPEIDYIHPELTKTYHISFPRDLNSFLKALKTDVNMVLPLISQELPENIYASANDEDEIQFIDKSLVEKKQCLSLLSPDKPELVLVGTWEHIEELVKLSQMLQTSESRISLYIINSWNYLFSEEFKENLKSKKLGIIINHEPTKQLKDHLAVLNKEIILLTPAYEKVTSIFPEYQFEQSDFDALWLFERILSCL